MGCSGSTDKNLQNNIKDLGGNQMVNKIIEQQYDFLLQNNDLNKFIVNINKNQACQHLKQYFLNTLTNEQKCSDFITQNPLNLSLNQNEMNEWINIFKNCLIINKNMNENSSLQQKTIQNYQKFISNFRYNNNKKQNNIKEKEIFENENSIYAKIGGMDSLRLAVSIFYERTLEDQTLNHFFKNTDMCKQEERFVEFLAQVFGGPQIYKGNDMLTTHRGMLITSKDYDRFIEILAGVLVDLKIPNDIIQQIAEIAASVKYDICDLHLKEEILIQNEQKQIIKQGKPQQEYVKKVVETPNLDVKSLQQIENNSINMFNGSDQSQNSDITDISNICEDNGHDIEIFIQNLNSNKLQQPIEVSFNIQAQLEQQQKMDKKDKQVKKVEFIDQNSIYSRIGGYNSVKAAIEIFYQYILEDKEVNQFFLNTDMKKQEERQIQFFVEVFGGPKIYKGQDLYSTHRGMGVQEKHYDLIVKYLAKALAELKVPGNIIGEIADIAASVKSDIVQI